MSNNATKTQTNLPFPEVLTPAAELEKFCESVERITGFPAYTSSGSCFLLFFFRDRSERDIQVPCSIIAKIAKTGLNQWFISRDFIDIKPGSGKPLRITYTPTGEYAIFSAYWLFHYSYFAVGLVVFLLGFGFSLVLYYTAGLLLCLAPPYLAAEYYHRLSVTLSPEGITIQRRGGQETFLPLNTITSVEKTWPRIKVTTADGRITRFPRGCWLLPELINELAGLNRPSPDTETVETSP